MAEAIREYSGGIEMSVVCSDLSLLESINALLGSNGVISIRSEDGVVHYIIDGRQNRQRASAAVTALVSGSAGNVDDEFFNMCLKSVFKEFGLDMSLIGSAILFDAVKMIYLTGSKVPLNMKSIYVSAAKSYKMTLTQIERDVRYAVKNSAFAGMRSRDIVQSLVTRAGRRIKLGAEGT
ncbi:MAG: sporulation initiation factor Spo0A C-terminal domain-containing protein [Saccharofermentans sp.]|nr:sporulation initiation factor Spo0A C-terminal domain-containing protein [Saccharofermentans sp.]